jgi:nicotinate-nucleotide adenylyltransferase
MQKLAIFGGTFNPVHWGHLLIAETALSQMQLDRILWLPAAHPAHKLHPNLLLNYQQRFHMVELGIATHPQFQVIDIQSRISSSFAIETLEILQTLYSQAHWYWIIGLDAFQTLPRWYGRRELADHCCWLVAPRLPPLVRSVEQQPQLTISGAASSYAASTDAFVHAPNSPLTETVETAEVLCAEVIQQLAAQSISIRWAILHMPLMGISSSLIRSYCRQQRSIRYLVPDAVCDYIARHQLYRV